MAIYVNHDEFGNLFLVLVGKEGKGPETTFLGRSEEEAFQAVSAGLHMLSAIREAVARKQRDPP